MNVDYLKSKLEELKLDPKDYGKEFRCRPSYRDSNNPTSLCIWKEDGSWYDFSANIGGSLKELVKLCNEEIDLDADELIKKNKNNEIKQQKTYDIDLLYKLEKNHEYWINRGISKNIITLFDGGVCRSGKFYNRYVFPVFVPDKKNIVGFSGRFLGEQREDTIKWKLMGQKSLWLYPTHLNNKDILEKKSVIVVESIANMLSFFELGIRNVIVLFGAVMSQSVICYLIKNNLNKITLLLDNDINNSNTGNKASEDICKKLRKHFDSHQIQNLTNELKFKDSNEWLQKDRNGFEEFCNTNLIK